MKKGEFIRVSKRMVKEYYNRYVAVREEIPKITRTNVVLIDYEECSEYFRAILITTESEGNHYGVTYDRKANELYSYIYKKADGRIIGGKNE